MKPALDVMWGVVPDEIVHDEFGHYISKKFFCIEVVIGNDTGYPVQIVSVGFTMDGKKSKDYEPLPSSGYQTARAMLEVGQAENPRSYALGAISLLSSLSGAGIPFLEHNSYAADYNAAVAALSSPITNGIKVIFPDLTIPELNRLDNQILRDGLLIPNNTQERTVVFVPKHVVLAFLCNTDIKKQFLNFQLVAIDSTSTQNALNQHGMAAAPSM